MKKNLLFYFFFISFTLAQNLSAQENYNAHVYRGNVEFQDKNFEKASSQYLEAIKLKENDFTAHYNLGNALYKRKQYDEASAEYQKAAALAKNSNDKLAALYNQGNVKMQQNEPEKAAELYKQALKQDPYNETARKNYEIAMLKKQEKEEQQQQKNQNSESDDQGKNNKDNGKDNGNQPQQNSGGNDKNQQGKGDGENQNEQGNSSGIPKEIQNAILDHVGEREKRTVQKILNKKAFAQPESNEKDW